MEVDKKDLTNIFWKQVRYRIPSYQRRYVWKQDEQWDPLWEDVRNTAESVLEDTTFKTAHFLGAVVLQILPTPAGEISVWSVVDGQQRLTTMQLLLDAVHEVFVERSSQRSAMLEPLVLNMPAFWGNDPDRAFKVWPTTGDQDAFRHAMRNELPVDEYEESLIVQAHEFFKLQIRQWLDQVPGETDARIDALYKAVTTFLQMVVIDLNADDDPHVIFETLNARGTPLLQSDMIKNLMLQEAGNAGITDDSEAEAVVWGELGSDWWIDEISQGRLVRPRVDVLLNYWLTMRKKEDVPANRVFRTFSKEYEESGQSLEAISAHIARVGKAYRALEDTGIVGMEKFSYRRRVMQAGAPNPALLWLLSEDVPQHQISKAFRSIESFLMRRMVCGMTTNDYNRLFIGLLDALEKGGSEYAGDTVAQYLRAQTAYSREWPDDRRMEEAFIVRPLYRLLTRGRMRIVLEGIEEQLRTDRSEDGNCPRNLTIEHVMPQAWRNNWHLSDEVEDKEDAAYRRDSIVHTIGNLTLVNNRLNPALSNGPWKDKRSGLREHSVLFLNKMLLDDALDVWDETAIEERAKRLCAAAIKVWTYAANIP